MAGAELLGDVILPQGGPRLERSGDDPVGQYPGDLVGESIVFGHGPGDKLAITRMKRLCHTPVGKGVHALIGETCPTPASP